MRKLPKSAANWLLNYKGGNYASWDSTDVEPVRPAVLKTLQEYTARNGLDKLNDVNRLATFRGVAHHVSKDWLLDRLAADKPILFKKRPYESWTVDVGTARGFSSSSQIGRAEKNKVFHIVMFRSRPKPRSILVNMAMDYWWEYYFDAKYLKSVYPRSPWFLRDDQVHGDWTLEYELLLNPQCASCSFERNMAWVSARYDFWMDYEDLSGVPVFYSPYNRRKASRPSVRFYGTYLPEEGGVHLLHEDSKESDLISHVKRRIGPSVLE